MTFGILSKIFGEKSQPGIPSEKEIRKFVRAAGGNNMSIYFHDADMSMDDGAFTCPADEKPKHIRRVEKFIQKYPNFVNALAKDGNSIFNSNYGYGDSPAIAWALRTGRYGVAERLIRANADLQYKDRFHETSFDIVDTGRETPYPIDPPKSVLNLMAQTKLVTTRVVPKTGYRSQLI